MISTPGLRHLVSSATLALGLLALAPVVQAAAISEGSGLEFSGDRLAPTLFALDMADGGNNLMSGGIGRTVSGVVDLDYVHVLVPAGMVWTGLVVGRNTTVGGGGSFLGLASGDTMPVPETTNSPAGLLGFLVYGLSDLELDVLPFIAASGTGAAGEASGFSLPLPAGSYTLWLQELMTGSFGYSFNLTTAAATAVPEPTAAMLALLALGAASAATSRRRRTVDA